MLRQEQIVQDAIQHIMQLRSEVGRAESKKSLAAEQVKEDQRVEKNIARFSAHDLPKIKEQIFLLLRQFLERKKQNDNLLSVSRFFFGLAKSPTTEVGGDFRNYRWAFANTEKDQRVLNKFEEILTLVNTIIDFSTAKKAVDGFHKMYCDYRTLEPQIASSNFSSLYKVNNLAWCSYILPTNIHAILAACVGSNLYVKKDIYSMLEFKIATELAKCQTEIDALIDNSIKQQVGKLLSENQVLRSFDKLLDQVLNCAKAFSTSEHELSRHTIMDLDDYYQNELFSTYPNDSEEKMRATAKRALEIAIQERAEAKKKMKAARHDLDSAINAAQLYVVTYRLSPVIFLLIRADCTLKDREAAYLGELDRESYLAFVGSVAVSICEHFGVEHMLPLQQPTAAFAAAMSLPSDLLHQGGTRLLLLNPNQHVEQDNMHRPAQLSL